MALMPGVNHRLIARHNKGAKMAVYNRVNLHVAVSEASSLFGYFSGVGDCSHFYVAKDGTIEQYMDTEFQSKADYQGNDATISIETQGGLKDAQNEPWTAAQLVSLARIWQWARDTHGIKNKLATSSRAVNDENKGLSYHRLGVPGYPTSVGGVLYSRKSGKICPGNAKIAQIPSIFNGGNAQPSPSPTPTPTPTPAPTPVPSNHLDPDGDWGTKTTKRAQEVLGLVADGEVWYQYKPNAQPAMVSGWVWNWVKGTSGSPLIRRMMEIMAAAGQYTGKIDGVAGTEFYKGLQRRYGTVVDGELWRHSPAVAAMQNALNAGRF